MINSTGITIIIPVFNVEEYIERCLNSIICQSYKGFEVIIVDDCSSDHSMDIATKLINENYEGGVDFIVLHHESNKGLSAARNTGINHASGNYLFFLDSDDYITHDCIERFVDIVRKYPNVDVIQGSASSNSVLLTKGVSLSNRHLPNYIDNKKWIGKAFLNSKIIPVPAWNKMIRKEIIINNDIFFKEGIIHEDVLWSFYLGKYVNSVAFLFDTTYFYWQRDNSIMTQRNIRKEYESYKYIIKNMFRNNTYVCSKYQKRRALKLFFYCVVRNHYYETKEEIEDILCDIMRNSTPWGRIMMKAWRMVPGVISTNRYFVAPFCVLYSLA